MTSMEVHAYLNHFSMSPRKVRAVTDALKGMPVSRALTELDHRTKRAARPVQKLLRSAIANAAHNFQLEEHTLFIKEIRVDADRVLKRFMPRAFGRAAPIKKRMSRVSLTLGVAGSPRPSRSVKPGSEAKLYHPVKRAPSRETAQIREVSPEELKREIAARPKGAREPDVSRVKKSKGFVRRIFQRKAI